jgi:hypothetical protein
MFGHDLRAREHPLPQSVFPNIMSLVFHAYRLLPFIPGAAPMTAIVRPLTCLPGTIFICFSPWRPWRLGGSSYSSKVRRKSKILGHDLSAREHPSPPSIFPNIMPLEFHAYLLSPFRALDGLCHTINLPARHNSHLFPPLASLASWRFLLFLLGVLAVQSMAFLAVPLQPR